MLDRKKKKQIFIIVFVLFMVALIYASYDISKRTTFPGSKPQLKERIKETYLDSQKDTLESSADSLNLKQAEIEKF